MTEATRSSSRSAAAVVALLCVAALMFDAAADVLPDTALLQVVTWQRVVIAAGLVAVVVAGARLRDFRTRLDIPVAMLVAAALFVTARMGGGAPLRHLLSYVALYYLLVALLRVERQAWRTLAMLASTAVTVAGTVAIGQWSQDVPTGFCRSGLLGDAACEPGMVVRAVGTFANPNLLAAFLLLLLPFGVLAVATITGRTYQVCVLALTLTGYAALLVTFSRAAYAAAFLGLLVLGWQRAPQWLSARQIRFAGWIGGFALVVAVVGIAVVSGAGRAFGVRSEAWSEAFAVVADYPFGVGLGRAGAVVNARIEGTDEFQHLHNLWLNWLVEAGVLGFAAVLAITVGAVVTAAGLARQGRAIGFACLAALAGFLTMNLMDHPSNLSRIAVAFWLVLGVTMGSVAVPGRSKPSVPRDQPTETFEPVVERTAPMARVRA